MSAGTELDASGRCRLDILGRLSRLPPLSETVRETLRLLDDPDVTAQQVASSVSRDQALATEVLRLVNSGFYGLPQSVASIPRATVLLGFNVMRDVVLSSSVAGYMARVCPGLYQHSIACSRACSCLARLFGSEDPAAAGTVGLLHDIGKTVLHQCCPGEYRQIEAAARRRGVTFAVAEATLFGISHASIGRCVLERWNLPAKTFEPIAAHHAFDPAASSAGLTAVLHLADTIVRAEGFGFPGDTAIPRLEPEVIDYLSLRPKDVVHVMEQIIDLMTDLPRYVGEQ